MVSVRVSSKLEPSWDFFSQRIEWRPKKIVLILRILENAVSSEKKKKQANKKATRVFWKFVEKHMKIHETKIPRSATKGDKYFSFMIAKAFTDR